MTLTQREGGLGYHPSSHPTTAPGAKVFFANSGTEANEGALKVARMAGKVRGGEHKIGIVNFEGSFHGRSMGALSVTSNPKYQKPFAPLIPGVRTGKLNQHEGLEELINDETCAVILEPIQGEGGVNVADVHWMSKVVRRAREVGAVVIFDEIQVRSSFASVTIPALVGSTFFYGTVIRGSRQRATFRCSQSEMLCYCTMSVIHRLPANPACALRT